MTRSRAACPFSGPLNLSLGHSIRPRFAGDPYALCVDSHASLPFTNLYMFFALGFEVFQNKTKTKWVLSLSGLLNAAFNTLLQVKCHHLRPRIPSHKIKAFICFPFGLDFQTGQTFTEMAQTVQINHRSSEEGSLHYSGSDEYGSHSPAL